MTKNKIRNSQKKVVQNLSDSFHVVNELWTTCPQCKRRTAYWLYDKRIYYCYQCLLDIQPDDAPLVKRVDFIHLYKKGNSLSHLIQTPKTLSHLKVKEKRRGYFVL